MIKSIVFLFLLLVFCAAAYGGPWQETAPFHQSITQIVVDRKHPQLVFAAAGSALWRSGDFGHHWTRTRVPGNSSIDIHPVTSKIYDISYESNHFRSSLWVSLDTGKSFVRKTTYDLLSDPVPGVVKVDPGDPRRVYAFLRQDGSDANGALLISTDGALHWRYFHTPQQYSLNQVLFSPFHSETIYLSAFRGTVRSPGPNVLLVSHDKGNHWRMIQHSPEHAMGFYFHNDPLFQRAFVSGANGIQLLTSSGLKKISSEPLFVSIISVPRHPEILFGLQWATDFGSFHLMKSVDRGKTWQRVQDDLSGKIKTILALDDPANSILAVAGNTTIFRRALSSF